MRPTSHGWCALSVGRWLPCRWGPESLEFVDPFGGLEVIVCCDIGVGQRVVDGDGPRVPVTVTTAETASRATP